MSFFYLEYAALALVVVYFARKKTLDEMKRGGELSDRSDAEIKKGQLKTQNQELTKVWKTRGVA